MGEEVETLSAQPARLVGSPTRHPGKPEAGSARQCTMYVQYIDRPRKCPAGAGLNPPEILGCIWCVLVKVERAAQIVGPSNPYSHSRRGISSGHSRADRIGFPAAGSTKRKFYPVSMTRP
jgi:hypothetical protein